MAARHPPCSALKPKKKDYKVTDRDGMYVHVTAKGEMSFRLDYRLNGRRETIYLGKYGPEGFSLARAREKCIDANHRGRGYQRWLTAR
jgi:Arm DNA-binding domain